MRNKLVAMGAAGMAVAAAVIAVAVPSFATTYDPTSDLTNLANSAGTQLGPIVVAVVTAFLGVFILFWGVRYITSRLGGRHR